MLNRAPDSAPSWHSGLRTEVIEARPSNCIRSSARHSMPISMGPDGGACTAFARGATRSRCADDVDQQLFCIRPMVSRSSCHPGYRAWSLLCFVNARRRHGQGMAFANIGEIEHALQAKAVTLHSRIKGGHGPSMVRASACRRFSRLRLAG